MASSLIPQNNCFLQLPCTCVGLPKAPLPSKTRAPTFCPRPPARGSHRKVEPKYWTTRASYEDFPAELTDDSKFIPLKSEDPKYGPPALLLLGFQVDEAAVIQQLLKELDGEFLQVIFCTEDMINGTLWEGVNTKQTNLEASKVTGALPRICFLSGLTGEEMMMFIDAFPETGLELPVFAAVVPNSAEKPIAELAEEIMGDHEMLAARRPSQKSQV